MQIKKPFKTRSIQVGNISIGDHNPIAIQSMTNTHTLDVVATSEQVMRLADSGCLLVRLAVPGKKEAFACEKIKNILIKKGYTTPIIADIHYYPPAALVAAQFVDKVRINPGNYCTDTQDRPLDRLEEKIFPLIELCKKRQVPIRIGVNYGSLSQRIVDLYGNSAQGMVVSAIEFAEIFRKFAFHDLFFSLKSTDALLMIRAYFLLVEEMLNRKWDYPLHLGVTEAGEGREGRIHSAVGIGTLLLNGIGDTIRVSLTEDPVKEIVPCKELIDLYENYFQKRDQQFPMSVLKEPTKEPIIISQLDKDCCIIGSDNPQEWKKILKVPHEKIVFSPPSKPVFSLRKFASWLHKKAINNPLYVQYKPSHSSLIQTGAEMGAMLTEGLVQGFFINNPTSYEQEILPLIFYPFTQKKNARVISCPSCGRTLYNIEQLTKAVKKKVKNLKNIKIAVMGCVVNGLREMGDADIGLLGGKKDHVSLYIRGKIIQENIPIHLAPEILYQKCLELL